MAKDIFISYSRRDSEKVNSVVSYLESKGFSIWIDKHGIESGDVYTSNLTSAIEQCKVLLFFSSEASNASKWTQREVHTADESDKRIIPIKLDKTVYNSSIKIILDSFDYVDLTDSNQETAMLNRLVHSLSKECPISNNENGKSFDSSSDCSVESNKMYLKIKTDEDCTVLIDEEEIGKAYANKLTKFPLAKGEYLFSCVSLKTGKKLDFEDINIIDGDVIKKINFNDQNTDDKNTSDVQYDNVFTKKEFITEDKDTDEAMENSVSLDVILISAGTERIKVINVLHSFGISLSDASGMVDCVPFKIKEKICEKEAIYLKEELAKAGAKAELNYTGSTDNKYYTIHLTSSGSKKLDVINRLKETCNIDFKEANDLIDRMPSFLKTGLTKYEADYIKRDLEEVGCSVEIKIKNYVDLGLPSGLKWALTNIGATKPEEAGDFYAWGEVETKKEYSDDNSLTIRKSEIQLIIDGIIDSKILTPRFDVATKKFGEGWRMPTKEDFDELIDKCKWSFTIINGVSGYKVESKINGEWIFLPVSGYRGTKDIFDKSNGCYWSSTKDFEENHSYYLKISKVERQTHKNLRCYGFVVRPVRK